jgi:hypothetical protein
MKKRTALAGIDCKKSGEGKRRNKTNLLFVRTNVVGEREMPKREHGDENQQCV